MSSVTEAYAAMDGITFEKSEIGALSLDDYFIPITELPKPLPYRSPTPMGPDDVLFPTPLISTPKQLHITEELPPEHCKTFSQSFEKSEIDAPSLDDDDDDDPITELPEPLPYRSPTPMGPDDVLFPTPVISTPHYTENFRPKLLPAKHCKCCSTKHSPSILCTGYLCPVCYRGGHFWVYCPYFTSYPKGADFDRAKYAVHCHCGNPIFDTDDWACPDKYCRSNTPKLLAKKCIICRAVKEHTTYECTKNKRLAAKLKLRDERCYSP